MQCQGESHLGYTLTCLYVIQVIELVIVLVFFVFVFILVTWRFFFNRLRWHGESVAISDSLWGDSIGLFPRSFFTQWYNEGTILYWLAILTLCCTTMWVFFCLWNPIKVHIKSNEICCFMCRKVEGQGGILCKCSVVPWVCWLLIRKVWCSNKRVQPQPVPTTNIPGPLVGSWRIL